MGLAGSLKGLKSRAPAPPKLTLVGKNLEEKSLGSMQWKMTASERMRYLDDIRKHSPLPDEAAFLNIPESGRLDLHVLKSVLYICGGCAGARFTTEDFTSIKKLINDMEQAWAAMDCSFKALAPAQKKIILDEAFVLPPAAESTTNESDDEDKKEEEGRFDGNGELEKMPDGVDEGVVEFHRLADIWSRLAKSLQDMVKTKQISLPSTEERKALIASFASCDPDGLDKAKSMPDWLEVLLDKYKKEGIPKVLSAIANKTFNKDGSAPNSMQSNPETIGKISVFFSWAVVGKISTEDQAQQGALLELLQASNDAQQVISMSVGFKDITIREKDGNGQGQEYWAKRLYDFMSKVREVKSLPKEEKALDYPWIWVM